MLELVVLECRLLELRVLEFTFLELGMLVLRLSELVVLNSVAGYRGSGAQVVGAWDT